MRVDNKILVDHFTEKVKGSDFVFFTGFFGLAEDEFSTLRCKLDEQQSEHRVIKNRLFKKICSNAGIEVTDEMDAVLKGHTSFSIGGSDVVSVAKVIKTFNEENEKLIIKGGLVDGKFISEKEVIQLAKLPSRQELIAKAVGSIAAPLSGIVGVLAANLRNVVQVLNALKEKKEKE